MSPDELLDLLITLARREFTQAIGETLEGDLDRARQLSLWAKEHLEVAQCLQMMPEDLYESQSSALRFNLVSMVLEPHKDLAVEIFRPVGEEELHLIRESGWEKWPPRLPEQPIFYPVTNQQYAHEIAEKWNAKDGRKGYVTQFFVAKSFMDRYEVQTVGKRHHTEWWIPAADLEAFNSYVLGPISVVETYPQEKRRP